MFDLLDFLLGTGWIGLLLVCYFMTGRSFRQMTTFQRRILILGLLQIVAVAISGLLRAETARLWIFLFPLWAAPIGLELSRWPAVARNFVYLALLAMLMSVGGNMLFVQGF